MHKIYNTLLKGFMPFLLLLIAVTSLSLSGCSVEEEPKEPGIIYMRISSDGPFSSYNDDNDGIPHGFSNDTYYQCEAGVYTYSAKVNNYSWTNKTYTLNKPGDGIRRNYSLKFVSNSSGMNSSLTYDDVDQ